jgi:hypothetical protein
LKPSMSGMALGIRRPPSFADPPWERQRRIFLLPPMFEISIQIRKKRLSPRRA